MNEDMYSQTRTEGLLSCPFCGCHVYTSEEKHNNYRDPPQYRYFITCTGCKASIASKWNDGFSDQKELSLKSVVSAWNKRADPCWCKDCAYFRDEVCVNASSDWVADYPSPYCSCEHCERKKEAVPDAGNTEDGGNPKKRR